MRTSKKNGETYYWDYYIDEHGVHVIVYSENGDKVASAEYMNEGLLSDFDEDKVSEDEWEKLGENLIRHLSEYI